VNKREIVKKVEARKEKHIPKVIDDVARGRAYSEVHHAMQEERDDAEGESPKSEAREHGVPDHGYPSRGERNRTTVVSPTDSRITGCK